MNRGFEHLFPAINAAGTEAGGLARQADWPGRRTSTAGGLAGQADWHGRQSGAAGRLARQAD